MLGADLDYMAFKIRELSKGKEMIFFCVTTAPSLNDTRRDSRRDVAVDAFFLNCGVTISDLSGEVGQSNFF